MPCSVAISRVASPGTMASAARNNAVLYEPARRLPDSPRTLIMRAPVDAMPVRRHAPLARSRAAKVARDARGGAKPGDVRCRDTPHAGSGGPAPEAGYGAGAGAVGSLPRRKAVPGATA